MHKLPFLLAAILLIGTLETARACIVGMDNYERAAARASTVFVGHVVRTEEAGAIHLQGHPVPAAAATFRVLGVLKGEVPADGKVRFLPNGWCSPTLLAGQTYAVFLYGDNLVLGHNQGLTRLPDAQSVDASRLVEHLNVLRKQWQERARTWDAGKNKDCSKVSERRSDEEAVAKAAGIFIGHLMHLEEVAPRPRDPASEPALEAKFHVLEVLKGQAPPDGKLQASIAGGPCLPDLQRMDSLVPGGDYLVFLDQINTAYGPRDGPSFIYVGGPIGGGVRVEGSARLDKIRVLSQKPAQ